MHWLWRTCGRCAYCRTGRGNLCDAPLFTGFHRDGGFASHCLGDAAFCFHIPDAFGDVEAAPLLLRGPARSADLTGADGPEFLELAARVPVRTTTTAFPLGQANEVMEQLRRGAIEGAAVLVPERA